MSSMDEPNNAMDPQDPELEFTDGGWDPYVASLLRGDMPRPGTHARDEDDDAPVMSLSQIPAHRPK